MRGQDPSELYRGVRLGAEAWYRSAMWGVGAGIDAAEKASSLALAGLGLADDARVEAEHVAAEALHRREGTAGDEKPNARGARGARSQTLPGR